MAKMIDGISYNSEGLPLVISFRSTQGSVATLLLAVACSPHANDTPCPRKEAAFHVQLTAPEEAPIPPDTAITVGYRGSESETFSVARPGHNLDVCCRLGALTRGALPDVTCPSGSAPVRVDSGSDAASRRDAATDGDGAGGPNGAPELTALFCELWTNGPATVHVTASGYAVMDRDLESKLRDDNCGVRTVDVNLVLVHPDGGSP